MLRCVFLYLVLNGLLLNASETAHSECRLGIGLTEGSVGFEQSLAVAQQAGLGFVEIPQQWDEVETSAGVYHSPLLPMVDLCYGNSDIALVLSLNPIDTTSRRVPAHLAGRDYDDPVLVRAYCAFIGHVISQLPNCHIVAVSVGNEIDATLAADPQAWQAYARLLAAARRHIHAINSLIAVGCKLTHRSILLPDDAQLNAMLAVSDVLMATYYPLDEDFQVSDPQDIGKDIDGIIAASDGKPVFLLETGYPSSAINGSSPARQAAFIRAIFAAWHTHRQGMPLLSIVWLHDISKQECEALSAYYGLDKKGFAAFLGTLGLRHHTGQAKPAYHQLIKEMQAMVD